MRYLVFLLAVLLTVSCSKKIHVYHVSDNTPLPAMGGFVFCLPATALNIEVTVKKTEYIPGPYSEYASVLLNLSNVVEKKEAFYSIEDVQMSQYVIPDAQQYYFVELPEKKKSDFSAELNELGMLVNMNMDIKAGQRSKAGKKQNIKKQQSESGFKAGFLTSTLKEKIDTIIERVVVDSLVIEKKSFRKNIIDKSDRDLAEEIAEKIFKLRKYRMDLVSGELETPWPGESLNRMLLELDNMLQEHMDLFTGTVETSFSKHIYHYTPTTSTKDELFVFSEKLGMLKTKDLRGKSVSINMEIPQNKQLTDYLNKFSDIDKVANGIPYRIPALTNVIIKHDDAVVYEHAIPIAQHGFLSKLPLIKSHHKLMMSDQTGGVLYIGN